MALCDNSATELRESLANGDLSAVELLDSCIERISSANPAVNAVVTTCFDRAYDEAKQADANFKAGSTLLPLHGLPLLAKDLADTAEVRTTYGSRCYKNHIPKKDAAAVSLLRQAGAILIGKTNTPEFGAGANTYNDVFGATRNPFNTLTTSGGSSGGSAVALACSMAPLATGSDLGGSLRIPASFCSVVGFRPSPGLVPSHSHVCGYSPLWTDGPMARNVADTRLCMLSMSDYSPLDPLSRPNIKSLMNTTKTKTDLRQLRVGFSNDLGIASIDTNIARVFENRKSILTNYFKSSDEIVLQLQDAADVFRVLRAESLYASFASLAEEHEELISTNVISNILEAKSLTLHDTASAHAAHTELFRNFQAIFNDIDVLLCPATVVTPFDVKQNHPTSINDESLRNYYSWYAITWVLSLMGCPVISIPCGIDHRGMPFGVQAVCPRYEDAHLLEIAAELEFIFQSESVGRAVPDLTKLHRPASKIS